MARLVERTSRIGSGLLIASIAFTLLVSAAAVRAQSDAGSDARIDSGRNHEIDHGPGHGARDGTAQAPAAAGLPRTPRPADAELYILSPADSETVSSPVTIRFGLRGMGVAPAGVASPNTGHHHLVVDAALPSLDLPLPADERNIHFGGGQTEVTLDLAPGPHELQLILGDQNHIPHTPPLVSDRITITVSAPD